MKKFNILSAALHKGFIFMAAAAVITVLSLSSCKEEKSEAATVYEMLQGTWVSTTSKATTILSTPIRANTSGKTTSTRI